MQHEYSFYQLRASPGKGTNFPYWTEHLSLLAVYSSELVLLSPRICQLLLYKVSGKDFLITH
jgi:hypothetical protein